MMWMLDTNTCSFILRRRPLSVKDHFDQVGHALAEQAVLVTNNTREFERVPNLKLEDWT